MSLEVVIFIVASAGIIYVSRASLLRPGSHGFYRFFAWELLVVLFLLNMRKWFVDPFSLHQIVSWSLLLFSLFPVIQGMGLLRQRGKPDEARDDAPMVGMEKTTVLVTEGIYRYIRHPLYSSLFFLGWGIFFKVPDWLGGVLAITATIFLILTARVEEGENVRYFGSAYQEYMKRTKMFVPFLF
ncbi:MAG: isoprenylcysteine carboxylmethyltransferase family protein [Anaerolineae bacterium]|nr:isoprenylcysteine carboxylmethyltransferase family protein [Anaerolineae bacterium]